MDQSLIGLIVSLAQVKAQEPLRPRASETSSQIQDGRIQDLGLEFEAYTIETSGSENSEFEALVSETLEFRNHEFKFI